MSARDRYRLEFRAEAQQRVQHLLTLLDSPNAQTFEVLHRETHGIKGTAAMFGELQASALAGALEIRSRRVEETQALTDADRADISKGLHALLERVQGNEGDDAEIIARLST